MSTQPYDEVIMDHIKNARNYRVLEDHDRQASGSNPLCGDDMVLYLKLDHDRIVDLGFQCTCCGISMASASAMTEMVKGGTIAEATRLLHDFATLVGNPAESRPEALNAERLALLETVRRFPSRAGCAMLPWQILESAMNTNAQV
ncbi:MAG TPA: SUF system NifU family Fe-S cluster assembly protein [Burkholderiales bacterium]|nr:SUF system NifU family Fe-S cluster assembly protein [Burkholderiales bacterium]